MGLQARPGEIQDLIKYSSLAPPFFFYFWKNRSFGYRVPLSITYLPRIISVTISEVSGLVFPLVIV